MAPEERRALADFYQATGGVHWKKKDGWLGTAGTECSWYGVECFDTDGESSGITGLDLYANDLKGRIPQSLAKFTHLKSLNIYGNHLSGILPDVMIERWLAGKLEIIAEPNLLTNIFEIDYRVDPSALLCGHREFILRSNTHATSFTTKCRNSTPQDRVTYCEVREGRIYSEFPRLSWLIEKSAFFALEPSYSRSITEGEFELTRVVRAGRAYENEDYAGAGPFTLWTIHRSIEGVTSSLSWDTTKRLPEMPIVGRTEEFTEALMRSSQCLLETASAPPFAVKDGLGLQPKQNRHAPGRYQQASLFRCVHCQSRKTLDIHFRRSGTRLTARKSLSTFF